MKKGIGIALIIAALLACISVAVAFLIIPNGNGGESADPSDEASHDSAESSLHDVSEESTNVFSEFIEHTETDDIEDLKQRYPQYFELDYTKGLTVYIWQLAPSHYSCGIMQGSPEAHEQGDIWALRSCTLSNMRKIVDYYIDTNGDCKVQICPVQSPVSSYYYEINSSYTHNLLNRFWFSWYGMEYGNFENAVFDVNGDGEDEMCTLTANPYTGMQYDYLVIYKNGQIKSLAVYGNSGCKLSFHKRADGTYCVKAEKWYENATYYLDICFTEDGATELKSDDFTLTPFGAQT